MRQIADIVKDNLGKANVTVMVEATNDHRSYHISSRKIKDELGFVPRHTIGEAVRDLKSAFDSGKVPDALTNMRYYNIKTMQAVNLT